MPKIAVLGPLIFMITLYMLLGSASAQQGGWGDMMPCISGEYRPCGINTGECKRGVRICEDGYWNDCQNFIGPVEEICANDKDDDCNGVMDDCIDNTFGYISIGSGIIILIIALILQKFKFGEKKEKF
jgi:hypothetical protein